MTSLHQLLAALSWMLAPSPRTGGQAGQVVAVDNLNSQKKTHSSYWDLDVRIICELKQLSYCVF